MWKAAFKKFEVRYGLLRKTISLQFFKGCLPQILFGPFLNTLTHISLKEKHNLIQVKLQKANICWKSAIKLVCRYMCYIRSKLTIKTLDRVQLALLWCLYHQLWKRSVYWSTVFIVTMEYVIVCYNVSKKQTYVPRLSLIGTENLCSFIDVKESLQNEFFEVFLMTLM